MNGSFTKPAQRYDKIRYTLSCFFWYSLFGENHDNSFSIPVLTTFQIASNIALCSLVSWSSLSTLFRANTARLRTSRNDSSLIPNFFWNSSKRKHVDLAQKIEFWPGSLWLLQNSKKGSKSIPIEWTLSSQIYGRCKAWEKSDIFLIQFVAFLSYFHVSIVFKIVLRRVIPYSYNVIP